MRSVDEILASVKDYLSPETLKTCVVKVCVLYEGDFSSYVSDRPAYASKAQFWFNIREDRKDEAARCGVVHVRGKRLSIVSSLPDRSGGIRVRCELYE